MGRTFIIFIVSLLISSTSYGRNILYPAISSCLVTTGEFTIHSEYAIQITSPGAVVRCSVVNEFAGGNSAVGSVRDEAPFLDISLQKPGGTHARCHGIYQTDAEPQYTPSVYALDTSHVQLVRIDYPRTKRFEFTCILTKGVTLFGYRHSQDPMRVR